MTWTDKMVEHLQTAWRDQTPASVLAVELSEMAGRVVTRNAVLGKIHRLGLTGAGAKPHHTRPERDKRERAVAAPASVGVQAATASAFAARLEAVKIEPSPEPPVECRCSLKARLRCR